MRQKTEVVYEYSYKIINGIKELQDQHKAFLKKFVFRQKVGILHG